MAWPEDALSADEIIVTSFRPHWKTLFIPFGWFVLGLIAIAVIFWVFGGTDWLDWILVLAVVIAVLVLVAKPLIDWWVTRYVLTNERLITRTGLIAKSGVEIPLENITNVNFSQTFFERILGAGDLLVESAGSMGQSKFANIPHPDDFAALLYKTREDRTKDLSSNMGTAAAPEPDATEKLARLKQLHNDGILTDEEYEEKRKKLVDEI
jgi:uncharacterized membrane protein YdbT with pleckstrin-like domain